MNEIRAWSAAVCMAALGCSAIRLLAPKAGSGKIFSLLTTSFFLCVLTLPLMRMAVLPDLDVDFVPQDMVTGLLEERVNEQLMEQIERSVVEIVNEAMAERNIVAKKVEAVMDISESGGIYMKQIIVRVDKQSVPIAAVVREVLEKQLETAVVIKTEE